MAEFDDTRGINELYWHSDRSIGDITQELGVSRNTLYGSIQPIPAGLACRECGDGMVFTNRTNRDGGRATCRTCGSEEDASARETEPRSHTLGEERGNGMSDGEDWSWRSGLAAVEPSRYALVGGAAALGMMVGAAAARALRDRI